MVALLCRWATRDGTGEQTSVRLQLRLGYNEFRLSQIVSECNGERVGPSVRTGCYTVRVYRRAC
jgi:hypothetical protein